MDKNIADLDYESFQAIMKKGETEKNILENERTYV